MHYCVKVFYFLLISSTNGNISSCSVSNSRRNAVMFSQRNPSHIHSTDTELYSTGEYNKHCGNHPFVQGWKLHLPGYQPVWNSRGRTPSQFYKWGFFSFLSFLFLKCLRVSPRENTRKRPVMAFWVQSAKPLYCEKWTGWKLWLKVKFHSVHIVIKVLFLPTGLWGAACEFII